MGVSWFPGQQETVNAVLARAAESFPSRIYLDFSGEAYTYGEIDALSTQLAAGLREIGVKAGDTVATILDNNVDAVLSWYAINKIGAISVPINTAYKGEFLRHQITDCDAKVVFADTEYVERIVAIADQLPDVETVACRHAMPEQEGLPFRLMLLDDLKVVAANFEPHPTRPSDLSMLIYTSGTTGPSKGCMISHSYACNLARQAQYVSDMREDDVLWTVLPLFHMNATATAVLRTAMTGGRCAIYPRFSLSNFWKSIEQSGATAVTLLGSMAPLIAAAPDNEYSQRCYGQIRAVSTAPFPLELQQTWKERFGVKYTGVAGYGFTEAAMVTLARIGEPCPPNSSGKRYEDFDVMIVDEDDNELPPGVPGEVVVRPRKPHVCFEGYWGRPEETLKIMRNMWLHTGDIGMFDEEGYFYFLDRKKDYLRRRGENISSYEMEKTFLAHPDIADVAVHAVFSEVGEDDVKVTALLREGARLTEEDLCRWCLDKVPYFAVPRYIEFRDDLPRNPTGKILKYQLREEGCTPGTWDREKSDFAFEKR